MTTATRDKLRALVEEMRRLLDMEGNPTQPHVSQWMGALAEGWADQLEASLAEEPTGWMPIETAPKDQAETPVLVREGKKGYVYVARFMHGVPGRWVPHIINGHRVRTEPTEWRPIP